MKQPNILLISSDQHIYNGLSALGNLYVETPNLDKLMMNGLTFERAYSPNPVCATGAFNVDDRPQPAVNMVYQLTADTYTRI